MKLTSIANPRHELETLAAAGPARDETPGFAGTGSAEVSRTAVFRLARGRVTGLPGGVVLETPIGPDDRARVLDTELAPWRMICSLRITAPTGLSFAGTGWLAGPRTVITAGHCVHSLARFGGWARKIEVIPGRNGRDSAPLGIHDSGRFEAIDRWVNQQDPEFDLACVHLLDDAGARAGWFAAAALPGPQLLAFRVNVAGYPLDRGAGTELYHHRDRIVRVSDRRLFHQVDTQQGQSGAPVWVHETDTSPPLVVGIHTYGEEETPPQFGVEANSASRILPEVLDQIRRWVQADGGVTT